MMTVCYTNESSPTGQISAHPDVGAARITTRKAGHGTSTHLVKLEDTYTVVMLASPLEKDFNLHCIS